MKKFIVLISLIALIMTLGACETRNSQQVSRTGFHLNTVIKITVYGGNGENSLEAAFNEIIRLENILSKNIESSEIFQINENAGIKPIDISSETYEVLNRGREYFAISNGYFDITIGPLVQLWGIGTTKESVPDAVSISAAMEHLGIYKLIYSKNSSQLDDTDMLIDTGGIAKGFIADRVAAVLLSENCSGAIINLGGNVLTVGEKPDRSLWKVGIQNPFETTGSYMEVVSISEMSVVTSGPYERNFEENGVFYHHILDPFTGYPVVNNIAGVTVISEKSIDGDALSTSVYAMGTEDGLALIESLNNTECYIVLNDGTIIMSAGFSKYLQN